MFVQENTFVIVTEKGLVKIPSELSKVSMFAIYSFFPACFFFLFFTLASLNALFEIRQAKLVPNCLDAFEIFVDFIWLDEDLIYELLMYWECEATIKRDSSYLNCCCFMLKILKLKKPGPLWIYFSNFLRFWYQKKAHIFFVTYGKT